MKLIADAGATKVHWALIHKGEVIEFKTSGYNPNVSDSNYLRQLLISGFPKEFDPQHVKSIWYYGTGCGSEFGRERVYNALNAFFTESLQMLVLTDLEGASKAALGDAKGIVGILGTGANAGVYNGKTMEQTLPSLGYLLGDEGSGSYLGKKLIQKIIRNELPDILIDKFFQYYALSASDLITKIYASTQANQYLASFTPFIKQHLEHPVIENIVVEGFQKYYLHYIKPLIISPDIYPFIMVGGVANTFSSQLTKLFHEKGINNLKIIESPLKLLTEKI